MSSFQLSEEVLGGFSAGIVGTLLGFPLDLVKTRMQTQAAHASGANQKAISTLSLLRHILRSEGLASVYKGVGPPLLSLSIVNTLSFTSYSYFRQNHFKGTDGWDYRNALSGMMGAPVFGIVTTPENFLKTQMQLDNVRSEREKEKMMKQQQQQHNRQQTGAQTRFQQQTMQQTATQQQHQIKGRFANSFHCAKTLASSNGVTVLYTGHVINTIREAAFVGTYFFCYEGYKCEFRKILSGVEKTILDGSWKKSGIHSTTDGIIGEDDNQSSSITSLAIPFAGGCAGATAWALTFPLDCVRAGVQGQPIPHHGEMIQKQGAIKVFQNLWQSKGIVGLYSGVGPSIARAFLVSGSRFSAYECAVWLCRWSGLTASGDGKFGDEGPGPYDD